MEIITLYVFIMLLGALGLYTLSVARFKRSFSFEFFFLLLGGVVILEILFQPIFFSEAYWTSPPEVTQNIDIIPAVEPPAPETTPVEKVAVPIKIPRDSVIEQWILEEKTQNQADAPTIDIVYPRDGAIFDANTTVIDVKAHVTDDNDPAPMVEGIGPFTLQKGYNAITVIAVDQDGNASHQFVIVERK